MNLSSGRPTAFLSDGVMLYSRSSHVNESVILLLHVSWGGFSSIKNPFGDGFTLLTCL